MTNEDLSGRRYLVTGAASGIGAETVRLLAASGARVTTLDRNPLSGDLEKQSIQHLLCDLTDEASIVAAINDVEDGLDGLINIAGVPGTASPSTILAVNFAALRQLTEGLAPQIVDGGAIVNVASIAGSGWRAHASEVGNLLATKSFQEGIDCGTSLCQDGRRAYELSKEAVLAWTMANCLRWWPRGVRLNAVSPGTVDTPILDDFRKSMGAERVEGAAKLIGRLGQPADVAPVITFLASRMAPWINGANVVVDGGLLGVAEAAALRT